MWQYNYDYLCHSSSHKYIDKYKSKSGKTVYVYDAKYVANHPISSIDKKTLTPSSGLRTNKNATTTRSGIKQIAKDKQYVNQDRQIQNGAKIGKEMAAKTKAVDAKAAKQREIDALVDDYNTKFDRVYEAASKLAGLGQKNSNARSQDIAEAGKYMQKYWEEWSKAYDALPSEEKKKYKEERDKLGITLWNLRNRMGLQKKEIIRTDDHGRPISTKQYNEIQEKKQAKKAAEEKLENTDAATVRSNYQQEVERQLAGIKDKEDKLEKIKELYSRYQDKETFEDSVKEDYLADLYFNILYEGKYDRENRRKMQTMYSNNPQIRKDYGKLPYKLDLYDE